MTNQKQKAFVLGFHKRSQCEAGVHWSELQKISVTRKPVTN